MSKDSKARRKAQVFSFFPTGEYYFARGLRYFNRRDLHKAKKYIERAHELEAGEPMIVCQLAIIYTELGDYEYSNELLQSILGGLDPYMTECHYFMANNYAHLGMFKEAYLHAGMYLDKEEDGEFSEDAEELIDLIELEMDELGETLDLLEDEDGLLSRQEKAREQLETGNFAQAIISLNEIVEEYPDSWSTYNNLALAHFYLGKTDEAFKVLDELLAKNPGNMHALCNMLVFHFYQRDAKKVAEYTSILEKIQPMAHEHRFKLAATFAMTGQYELAYKGLRLLQKKGFEPDSTFYYWLADSAYHLGYDEIARQAWKKLIAFNPEKEGMEPWNDKKEISGFEDHFPSIIKRLKSDLPEERLFGIFLTMQSKHKKKILSHDSFKKIGSFSEMDGSYAAWAEAPKKNQPAENILFTHKVADLLFRQYRPINLTEAGLFLLWFSVSLEAAKSGAVMKNPEAMAASISYTWHKLRNEEVTQKETAEKYGVSAATLRKYLGIMDEWLS
ncbi:tetratricopeptide repeat protein [Peribacillus kribbensis]|uniref:tetratricopeptide repeat protein n=1 Tax=Peribacillus kribbensis TaxID=356658 RepID=UPI0003F9646B|nr:tetratricopeptide repeat protein [Peribacillus kribbensis]